MKKSKTPPAADPAKANSVVRPASPEPEAPETKNSGEKQTILVTGEKGFSIILLLFGLAALALALQLWAQMDAPKIASAAGIPVIVSAVWCILALWSIIDNFKYQSPLSKCKGLGPKLKAGINYVMPLDVFIIILAILAYCLLLYFKISFYLVTPLFLYGCMCYLARGKYIKNMIWTAIIMVFIYVVFRLLFNVIFP